MNKRKRLVSLLAGFMAAVMILTLLLSILPARVSAASSSEIREEIDAMEQKQEDIWAQLDELESQQSSTYSSMEEMVAYKDNIDQQMNLLNTEIELMNKQVLHHSLLIAENQAQLDEAQAVLDQLNERNRARIQAMEEEGRISIWSVIFRANSFTDLLDRLNMMREIQEADQRRLNELDSAAAAVRAARSVLDQEKVELETTRQELSAAQAELDAKRKDADQVLADLNSHQQELIALYEKYEAMEAELSEEIAQAEKDYTAAVKAEEEAARREEEANQVPSASASGWYRPCSWVRLSSAYGWRIHPITGKNSFHNGVDLANDYGTPIYATRSGRVSTATYHDVYGYYVQINHGDGFSSLYGHMTHYVVSYGDYVEAGQLIGYMGSTGWSTGPHLHFTIYYNGSTVNPMNYI